MTLTAVAAGARRRSRPLSNVLLRHAPWLRIVGPAFAVSIGYIDPGNWATDLAAGAYGYRLLWAVVAANVIALVLQLGVAEFTITSGTDLATAMARRWPRWRTPMWLTFQGAAVATDVAEFAGIVLGLEMIFRIAVIPSVAIGLAIVAALFALTDRTAKSLEYLLIGAIALIGIGCVSVLPALHPAWNAVLAGATVPAVPDATAVVIVVGIIGATVMPHNLFLHSALVEASARGTSGSERRARGRFFGCETTVALNVAALINAAILIVGAALHGAKGSIAEAFAALRPAGSWAATFFGAALLISGIAASMTATVSGDYIFAAFSPFRIPAAARRALTLVPAACVIAAGTDIAQLLLWSQVALALILPAVLIPLVLLMRGARGSAAGCTRRTQVGTLAMALVCVGFDAVMIAQITRG